MVWFKVDDTLNGHPKARRAGLAAMGLWTMAGSHCGQQLTDGFVEDWFVRQFPSGVKLAGELVRAGLFEVATKDGAKGWQFHDWSVIQPSSASVKLRQQADRNRQKLARDKALRDAIRRRDGDRCRYCDVAVRWIGDRVSPISGTYDHVNPKGDTSLGNCVVSCRSCNSYKAHRTPRQAGMVLLDPKGSVPGSRASSRPGSDPATEGVTPRTPQVGSGQVGSGPDGLGPAGVDDGPSSVGLPEHSWNPADYALADVSPPPTPASTPAPVPGQLLDPYEDVPLPGLDSEPPLDPHEHDEDPR